MAQLPTTFSGLSLAYLALLSLNSSLTSRPAEPIPIAIIGGTGLSSLPSPPFTPIALLPVIETPWGLTSSPIAVLSYTPPPSAKDRQHLSQSQPIIIAFLSRHGLYHQYAPHEVPFRANVAALRKLGVRSAVGFSAVGSLREEVRPRDFLVVDQVVDWTRGVSFGNFIAVFDLWHGTLLLR